MIRIHTLSIGQPRTLFDSEGPWQSTIYRKPVAGALELTPNGFVGDKVTDTKHHGSPDQAVCCHPLEHYHAWNSEYGLTGETALSAGAIGENLTLENMTEADVCIGDTFMVGTARVQVSAPRYPCWKQERKLGLKDFVNRTLETRRTGFYVRVLTPGEVAAGDEWRLESRPHPEVTVARLLDCALGNYDADFAAKARGVPELMPLWGRILEPKAPKEL